MNTLVTQGVLSLLGQGRLSPSFSYVLHSHYARIMHWTAGMQHSATSVVCYSFRTPWGLQPRSLAQLLCMLSTSALAGNAGLHGTPQALPSGKLPAYMAILKLSASRQPNSAFTAILKLSAYPANSNSAYPATQLCLLGSPQTLCLLGMFLSQPSCLPSPPATTQRKQRQRSDCAQAGRQAGRPTLPHHV